MLAFLPLVVPDSAQLTPPCFTPPRGYRSGLPPIFWSSTPITDFCDTIRMNRFIGSRLCSALLSGPASRRV